MNPSKEESLNLNLNFNSSSFCTSLYRAQSGAGARVSWASDVVHQPHAEQQQWQWQLRAHTKRDWGADRSTDVAGNVSRDGHEAESCANEAATSQAGQRQLVVNQSNITRHGSDNTRLRSVQCSGYNNSHSQGLFDASSSSSSGAAAAAAPSASSSSADCAAAHWASRIGARTQPGTRQSTPAQRSGQHTISDQAALGSAAAASAFAARHQLWQHHGQQSLRTVASPILASAFGHQCCLCAACFASSSASYLTAGVDLCLWLATACRLVAVPGPHTRSDVHSLIEWDSCDTN